MKKILLIAFFIAMMVSGCSSIYGDRGIIEDRNHEYLKSYNIPPTKIPPGLKSEHISSYYHVPQRAIDKTEKMPRLTPPGL